MYQKKVSQNYGNLVKAKELTCTVSSVSEDKISPTVRSNTSNVFHAGRKNFSARKTIEDETDIETIFNDLL